MIKKTQKSTTGTSFHNVTFKANVNELIEMFGEPTVQNNTGKDKCNFDWSLETGNGNVFTIYDWKEYRKLHLDEIIKWHIGSHSRDIAEEAKSQIHIYLNLED
jgi:hypothetical protein